MSVIVTVYNQPLEAVLATLRSIIYQQNVEPEILVADDCSDDFFEQDIRDFFACNGYKNYRIIQANENVQTVRNILRALRQAEGAYVKVIGAGDLLYDKTTLESLLAWSHQHEVKAGFGKILRFEHRDDCCQVSEYNAPLNAGDYAFDRQRDGRTLLKRQLVRGDWIPAGAQFFEKELFVMLLERLSAYGVRYCEDFAATLALELSDVAFYPAPVEWYEWGVGISTGDSKKSRERLYRDHDCLYKALAPEKPLGLTLVFPKALFGIKKFIALSTPWYSFFRKRLVESYARQQCDDVSVSPNDFLRRCLPDA